MHLFESTSYFFIYFALENVLKFIKYIFYWNLFLNYEKVVLLISFSYGQCDHKNDLVGEDWWIDINSIFITGKTKELSSISASTVHSFIHIIFVFLPLSIQFFPPVENIVKSWHRYKNL